MREARDARGWTQKQLAARLGELGLQTDRATIARIESGGQRASRAPLDEVMAIAFALDVAPVHLLTPKQSDANIAVAPKHRFPAVRVREWIRGNDPLGGDPLSYFLAEIPENERSAVLAKALRRSESAVARMHRAAEPDAVRELERPAIEKLQQYLDDQVDDRRAAGKEKRKPGSHRES